jgi:predicted nucleic acid-binding protein
MGSNDLRNAAQTESLGLTVVTNNESGFQSVEGLPAENWVKG